MSIIFDFRQIRERCEALGFDYIVPDEELERPRKTIVQVKLPEFIKPDPIIERAKEILSQANEIMNDMPFVEQVKLPVGQWEETKEKILKYKMPDLLSRNEDFWKKSYERLRAKRFSIWDHREEFGIAPLAPNPYYNPEIHGLSIPFIRDDGDKLTFRGIPIKLKESSQ